MITPIRLGIVVASRFPICRNMAASPAASHQLFTSAR